MSDHGAPAPRDDSPESSTSRTSRRALNFEFIDSQNPNTKSQIQRHTAHHAVQQRREAARQRLSRESSTPRILEWQRRSNPEGTSPPTSTSPSTTPGPSVSDETVQKNDLTSSSSETPVNMQYTVEEEALLQYYALTRCTRRSHGTYFARLLKVVRDEPSAAYLVIAYAARQRADSGASHRIQDVGLAADYKVKSLTMVNDRLTTARGIDKASDQNILAVLFLLAYETQYGASHEATTHLSGLRGMIHERGGLRAFEQNVVLRHLLLWVELSGNAVTILGCGPDCDETLSIPDAAFSRISLSEPGPRNVVAQSFINNLRQFSSPEHDRVREHALVHSTLEYQIASAVLWQTVMHRPASSHGVFQNDCRLACLFYVHALIFTSYNSVQKSWEILNDTMVQHYRGDYPISESPSGLLWVFLYSLQLSNEDNVETLRMVIDMMQAARLLNPMRLELVLKVLGHLFFGIPSDDEQPGLEEADLVQDIMG